MEVLEFNDPEEFRAFADSLLLAAEAENCLLLGVTGTLISQPEIYREFRLWVVAEHGTPVGAAAITPPHNLLLAHSHSVDWLPQLSRFITGSCVDLPGAQGTAPMIDRFCAAWESAHAVRAELEVELGIHALTEVSSVPSIHGGARPANEGDFDLLIEWFTAFLEEADPLTDRSRLAAAVKNRLSAEPAIGGTWLWQVEEEPVSLSGYGGRTPNGIRIGPVYTPPAHRGHGYATALVAQQTSWLLEQGHNLCFLFADMSNPTSHSIYQRIGYRKVADAKRYGFRASPPNE